MQTLADFSISGWVLLIWCQYAQDLWRIRSCFLSAPEGLFVPKELAFKLSDVFAELVESRIQELLIELLET